MALASINLAEIGTYQPGAVCPYASRKEAAQLGAYAVVSAGGGSYWVQREGGVEHRVTAFRWGGALWAGCDCYDFSTYGAGWCRACQHIWAVVLTQDIVEY